MILNEHKTKITGALLVLIGALQANSQTIQGLVSPETFAWFTVGAGALVAVLGFLNSNKDRGV
jgi:hypothetical protein